MSEKQYIVIVRGKGYASENGAIDSAALTLSQEQARSAVQRLIQMGLSAGDSASDVTVWASTHIEVSATVDIVD